MEKTYARLVGGTTLHVVRAGIVMLCGKSGNFTPYPESTVKALGKMARVCKTCEKLKEATPHE